MLKTIKIKSPANIAFIKYWGQKDSFLVLPYNDSFSMNLSNCYTILKIEVFNNSNKKELYLREYKSKTFSKVNSIEKIIDFYNFLKKYIGTKEDYGFRIFSENTFPKKAGIASSASFYSALTVGFYYLFTGNKRFDKKELSILARRSGSGSACRSIPDGFVWWQKGKDDKSSFAYTLKRAEFWSLVDLVLILTLKEKEVSSQQGHLKAPTSPFFQFRVKDVNRRLKLIKEAFLKKDFTRFGELLEEEALSLHFVMMTQKPPLYFWSGRTIEIIKKVIELRKKGIEVYYTIDAGENVHLICEKRNYQKIFTFFKQQKEVKEIIINFPAKGTKIL